MQHAFQILAQGMNLGDTSLFFVRKFQQYVRHICRNVAGCLEKESKRMQFESYPYLKIQSFTEQCLCEKDLCFCIAITKVNNESALRLTKPMEYAAKIKDMAKNAVTQGRNEKAKYIYRTINKCLAKQEQKVLEGVDLNQLVQPLPFQPANASLIIIGADKSYDVT